MSRYKDVKEATPNTPNAGKGVATSALGPRLTAYVREMLLRRKASTDLSRRIMYSGGRDSSLLRQMSQCNVGLAGRAHDKLEWELRSLPYPAKILTEILQHMMEASSTEDAAHGFNDILQRYEDERLKKKSSSSN